MMNRQSSPRLEHLRRLTDSRGLLHAAIGDCPDRFAGYDALDNADALRLCAQVSHAVAGDQVHTLARTFFECLRRARRDDGRVYLVCDVRGIWSNGVVDLPRVGGGLTGPFAWEGRRGMDDALIQSRLARALAAVIVSELPIAIRLTAADWWRELIPHADEARSAQAAANWLIAIGQLHAADPGRDLDRAQRLADWLTDECYATYARPGWNWFMPQWEIGAACIAEGMWHAGEMLDQPRYTAIAEASTRFLMAELFKGHRLDLPGTGGEWPAASAGGRYAQSPLDVAALVELLCTAERISGDHDYGDYAERAARWFSGGNRQAVSLVDPSTGGCHDLLTAAGVHPNQGAPAIVAYLLTENARAARASMLAEPPVYVIPVGG